METNRNLKRNLFFCIIIFFNLLMCHSYTINAGHPSQQRWKLNIVHTNDMHSRFEETTALSTECSAELKKTGQCFGGFPRIATVVRKLRNSNKYPTIFLNAGDTYQGSAWYNLYKWEIVSKFMNILRPDAATLGNHEFDDGPEGLAPFLKNVSFPIVASNVDFSKEPVLASTNVSKSVVLNIDSRKIGVIGYLTPSTRELSTTGKVIFYDEIKSIQEEVNKLKSQGVDIFIALGHSGYEVDKIIAAEVDGLDLVIGGHSHTFLYSDHNAPSNEKPAGFYPTLVRQKNGRAVYVVQAYAYTKYLGNIMVTFDNYGEVRKVVGSPMLLDRRVEQAPDVLEELDKMRSALSNLTDIPLGYTKVYLNGEREVCRKQECNLGNLIVDAMIEYNLEDYAGTDGWTDAAIAIHNSGSVRASISKAPNEPITTGDVLTVLSLGNVFGKTTVTGKQLLAILEHSVADLSTHIDDTQLSGRFLHYSGIQVAYDLSKPVNHRVMLNAVYVRCAKCREPKYEKLNLEKEYTVLTHNYLYDGGNGYTMFKTNTSNWISTGVKVDQVLANYIRKMKYLIHVSTERRIKFVNWSDCTNKRRRKRNFIKTRRTPRINQPKL